jgi:hypothetical protein
MPKAQNSTRPGVGPSEPTGANSTKAKQKKLKPAKQATPPSGIVSTQLTGVFSEKAATRRSSF